MKHAKEEHYVANVPTDSYYRARIRTLQDKLDKSQREIDLKDAYIASLESINKALNIASLESINKALNKKVERLSNAAVGLLEDKFNV